uniref:(California timema) hypothetical protein n=1 Tax=Timema californicum TaxID=61474 RepID=A0A7R9JI52_TIMCA|nr:unnamed protein product [Timema californicum]
MHTFEHLYDNKRRGSARSELKQNRRVVSSRLSLKCVLMELGRCHASVGECEMSMSVTMSVMSVAYQCHAMVDRANLSMTKDPNLVMSLLGNKDLTQFGKQLSLELYRNSSSWVYYNLGSIYWQMKGDAYHAVECARRAVHYAPR